MPSKKLRVLIADQNRDNADMLSTYLSRMDDLTVTGVANDGRKAAAFIKDHKPHFVVMEMFMSYLDGLEILERYYHAKHSPVFIMLSETNAPYVTREAFRNGAAFFILKPISPLTVYRRIKMLEQQKQNVLRVNETQSLYSSDGRSLNNPTKVISKRKVIENEVLRYVHYLRIPHNVKGFKYVKEAIMMVTLNRDVLHSVTKELYPPIAEKFISTDVNVERAIRHALFIAWKKMSLEAKCELFGEDVREQNHFKNAQAIALIADRVRSSIEHE